MNNEEALTNKSPNLSQMMAEYADMFSSSHLKFFLFLVALCIGGFGIGSLILFFNPSLNGYLGALGFLLLLNGGVCIAFTLFVVASPLLARLMLPLVICLLEVFKSLLFFILVIVDQVIQAMVRCDYYPNRNWEKPK